MVAFFVTQMREAAKQAHAASGTSTASLTWEKTALFVVRAAFIMP